MALGIIVLDYMDVLSQHIHVVEVMRGVNLSFICSPIRSFAHASICPFMVPFVHPCVRDSARPCVHPSVLLSIRLSSIRFLVRKFVRASVHLARSMDERFNLFVIIHSMDGYAVLLCFFLPERT